MVAPGGGSRDAQAAARTRPRWHDAAIVLAILGVLAVGIWALWWDAVRAALGGAPAKAPPAEPAPATHETI